MLPWRDVLPEGPVPQLPQAPGQPGAQGRRRKRVLFERVPHFAAAGILRQVLLLPLLLVLLRFLLLGARSAAPSTKAVPAGPTVSAARGSSACSTRPKTV